MSKETSHSKFRELQTIDETIVSNMGASDGTNLKVLMNARAWFSEQGEDIRSYLFVIRSQAKVTDSSQGMKCAVCGVSMINESKGETKFNRMFIFRGEHGFYPTCYKMNICFDRIGYKMKDLKIDKAGEYTFDQTSSGNHSSFKVPTYIEFLGLENLTGIDSVIFKLAEANFNKVVRPFALKWGIMDINKSNLNEFLVDWSGLLAHTSVYYEDEASASTALLKIQKMIGINNGKV